KMDKTLMLIVGVIIVIIILLFCAGIVFVLYITGYFGGTIATQTPSVNPTAIPTNQPISTQLISLAAIPAGTAMPTILNYSAGTYTFTVPSGVTSLNATIIGGGGGGGGGNVGS